MTYEKFKTIFVPFIVGALSGISAAQLQWKPDTSRVPVMCTPCEIRDNIAKLTTYTTLSKKDRRQIGWELSMCKMCK